MKHSILVTRIGDAIAAWNNPAPMLNWYATGWHGDPYALVQKQRNIQEPKTLAESTRNIVDSNISDSASILSSLVKR